MEGFGDFSGGERDAASSVDSLSSPGDSLLGVYKTRLADYSAALSRREEARAEAQREVDTARTLLTAVENEIMLRRRDT